MRAQKLYEQYRAGMQDHADHLVLVEQSPGQYVTFDYTAAMLQSFSALATQRVKQSTKRLQATLNDTGVNQLLGLQFKVVIISSGGAS